MGYCTVEDVIEILSEEGVNYRIDDNENGHISTNETARVQTSIDQASLRIDFWMSRKYFPATLDQSQFIMFCCVWISSRYLCRRRGGGVPTSIDDTATEMEDMLKQIYYGQAYIPDVPPDTNSGISSIVVGTMKMGYEQPFRKQQNISTPEMDTMNNRWLNWRYRNWR